MRRVVGRIILRRAHLVAADEEGIVDDAMMIVELLRIG